MTERILDVMALMLFGLAMYRSGHIAGWYVAQIEVFEQLFQAEAEAPDEAWRWIISIQRRLRKIPEPKFWVWRKR